MMKSTKQSFFNDKIQEITLKNQRLWDLMNWVKKRNIPAIKTIQFNKQPYIKIEDLWNTLYLIFNSAQSQQVNYSTGLYLPSLYFIDNTSPIV